jgi:benzoyl-CoA reductase/2-hydroxyglutaryl-CoA dehydratase subunit BcrC/BadD/HgdB
LLWPNKEAVAAELRSLQDKHQQQLEALRADLKQQLASGNGVVEQATGEHILIVKPVRA